MKQKPTPRTRGLGKSIIINDMKKILAGTVTGTKITAKELDFLVKLYVGVLRIHVLAGKKLTVPGLGTFSIGMRKGRVMTQAGGKKIQVGDYKIVKFKASSLVKKVVNGKDVAPAIVIPTDLNIVKSFKRPIKSAQPKVAKKNGTRKQRKSK